MTTKEIAAAARVSDGTIFSVFKDKEELLLAALEAALDPAPALAELDQIDPHLPLEDRVTQAVGILCEMVSRVIQLSGTLQMEEVRGRLHQHTSFDQLAKDVLQKVFEPSQDELRVDAQVASRALLSLATAGSSPMFFDRPLSTAEIVELLMDGIRGHANNGRRRSGQSALKNNVATK